MITILDNHMLIYYNYVDLSRRGTLGSDSHMYGDWTYNCFVRGKFTGYPLKYTVSDGNIFKEICL